ncbi:MAG: hypothetical protein R8J85_05980, partial [Mariprofundales bacterium]
GSELTAGKWTDPQNNTVINSPIGGRTLSVYGGTVVVGEGWGYGGIMSSQDGGVTWNYQPWIGNNMLRPQMIDAKVGFAVDAENGDLNRIFETTDGGLTWNAVAVAGGVQWATNLDFLDAYTGWVVGENELITKITLPVLASGSNTISGTITNGTSPLQAGKIYALLYSQDWAQPLAYVAVDSTGAFQLSSLADGIYNLAAVVDTNGTIDRYGLMDQSVDPIGDYPTNPLTVSAGVVSDKYGALVASADITITGLSNRYYFPAGTTVITWTAIDANNTTITTTQSVVVGATKQSWQGLKTNGDTAAATAQFTASLATDPTNIEAVVGLCVTHFADLLSNAQLRGLLTSMTSDVGATLPSSATVAMSIANKTALQKVNWLSRMAINGTQVQTDAFTPIVPQISGCITQLESALGAGFVSQSISNPAALLGGSASVQVDVDDVNLMLAQMYALRSQIYWLDAYNWDTDVDGDSIVDTLDASFTDSYGTIYQYQTINVNPYAVFNDPTFFTKRASGAFNGTGAQDLTASLADAQIAASKGKAVMVHLNANTTRGIDGNHLFSFADVTSLTQNLTDATNADSALNGTGYSKNFSQPGGGTLMGTVRADLFYPLFDRNMLPQLEYDVPPDPVASKRNNSPMVYDDRAGNSVSSSIYFGSYPDPTVGGALSGGATLDKQDQKTRPAKSIVLNIGGVPVKNNQQFTDPTGFHFVFWPGGVMGDRSNLNLFAIQIDQNYTTSMATYTVYNVDLNTGALTVNRSGTLSGTINSNVSGVSIGSNFFIPGQTGLWKLTTTGASLIPVTVPLIGGMTPTSTGTSRSDGSATGVIHWYYGNFTSTQFVTLKSLTSGGTASLREQYPLGALDFSATPLGSDSTLGWLIFEPNSTQLTRVLISVTTPTSAKTYYSPWLSSGWRGHFHLANGQMVDAGHFPKVSFYPLPAQSTFPTTTSANVTP